MIKWVFIFLLFYVSQKIITVLIPIFKINKKMKHQESKRKVRTKINKMDILDAEFEEDA
jgi:hypothetical protein|tara:strand:- start:138 stop:314 length:177 start_codon:yes stop_codon:yes gene_type:complete